jgi:vacuolar-type H+-ATPase subunit E/Vma4
MALADITDKIRADARDKAHTIIAAAKIQAAAVEKEGADTVSAIISEREKALMEECAENNRRITLAAQQEAKLARDRARREALNHIFSEALETLLALDDKRYSKLLHRLLKVLPEEKGKIIIPQAREAVTKAALEEVKRRDTPETTKEFKGGFIVQFDNAQYNFTFEKLLQDKKQELELKIASILFS